MGGRGKQGGVVLRAVIVFFMISGIALAQDEVTVLQFELTPDSRSDTSRTLQSLVKVQCTGGPCQDGLYLMTHFGDREDLFQNENQAMIDNPLIEQTWRYRSISETLDAAKGNVDGNAGLNILQDVQQNGTTWSALYSLTTRGVYFSVYQQWDTVYHLKITGPDGFPTEPGRWPGTIRC